MIGGRRYWRMPVMEGEFLVEESFGMVKGVGGGNILMLGRDRASALRPPRRRPPRCAPCGT